MLYSIGIILLMFGQRSFWEEMLEAREQKELEKKMAGEAHEEDLKPFEVQELSYDPTENIWNNNSHYFQTVHVGNVNFKALKKTGKTSVETNDDENASDSI